MFNVFHFMFADWNYHDRVLATRAVKERHTAENTAAEIKLITHEFGIKDEHVSAIVTDNASNMVACVQQLQWTHVRCFGHMQQLVSGQSLPRTIAPTQIFTRRTVTQTLF